MTATQEKHRLTDIADALAIVTHDLSGVAHAQVVRLVYDLSKRVACEAWGREMGWDVPPHGSPEWLELYTAWIESE
jgi:hypothetical protein